MVIPTNLKKSENRKKRFCCIYFFSILSPDPCFRRLNIFSQISFAIFSVMAKSFFDFFDALERCWAWFPNTRNHTPIGSQKVVNGRRNVRFFQNGRIFPRNVRHRDRTSDLDSGPPSNEALEHCRECDGTRTLSQM